VHHRPDDDFGYLAYAVCLLQAGDVDRCAKLCRDVDGCFGSAEDALQAVVTAKTCLIPEFRHPVA
jgi:hypothetical protein